MIILLHSSKTMRPASPDATEHTTPQLLNQAIELASYLQQLNEAQIAQAMHVSAKLAQTTHGLVSQWTSDPSHQRPAIDSFLGDIYSGLQVGSWSDSDRAHAQKSLRILSGLYGILRPLDGIYPYRLEMGCRLPSKRYANLYTFWGDSIASSLPTDGHVVNLSAVEYSKTITKYVDTSRVITPSFLTVKNGTPTFVVVHAKIARGAFARWLIVNRITDLTRINEFKDIGYRYDASLSTPLAPVFVCTDFTGIGLSVRLT